MTKPIKIFSDTERQEIFDSYYNDTFTSAEKLQKHYGGSLSYMKRLIKDFESGKVDQLNQNQIDEIVNLYNNDNTITNISKETKISIKIISKVLDKLNLRKSNRDGEVIVGNAMSVDISGSNAYDKNVYNKIEYCFDVLNLHSPKEIEIYFDKEYSFKIAANTIANHLERTNRRKKANVGALTTDQYIEEVRKIHGNNYDYSKIKYINSYTNITIICNTCKEEFEKSPKVHKNGGGCNKCTAAKKKEIKK